MSDDPDRHGAYYASLKAGIPAFVTVISLDGTIEDTNLEHRGLDPTVVVGRNVFEFIEPEYHDVARACFDEVLRTGVTGTYESQATTAEGHTSWYENHVHVVIQDGAVVGLTLISIDVSERAAHERIRRTDERRYRFAIEATGLGAWSVDLKTGEVDWSERMTEISGFSRPVTFDEFIEIVHPDDRASARASNDALLRDGHFQGRERILVDGEIRWIQTFGRAHLDEQGAPTWIAGAMLDVTEQQQVEARLRRAEKLEAVGQMTAGVAHNFNNMLMALLPSLELLDPHVDEAGRPHLDAAREVAGRAAEIIRQLTSFASPDRRPSEERVLLSAAVTEAVRIAEQTFDRVIQVRFSVESDCVVAASASDLSQVVMNLMLNARDALRAADGPDPRIWVTVGTIEDPVGPDGQVRAGALGRVVVADNGTGMTGAILDRIFEPFFTTKGDRGTGLGLAASYAIIRRAGGWISVDSHPGAGTRFELVLPLASAESVPTSAPTRAPDAARPVTTRILVVDDEPLVRRVAERALTRVGFEVVLAGSVQEAKAVLESDRDFALAVVDRSMPGAPGHVLVTHIRETAPDIRVAFLTGDIVIGAERDLVDGILGKPMTASELVAAVRELLVGSPERIP